MWYCVVATGMPPPRYLRPPGMPPPSVPPPLMPPGTGPVPSPLAPASAPPAKQLSHARTAEDDQQHTATIEAKPQIKHIRGDVTRFTPTAIKVKREVKDAKGRLIKPIGLYMPSIRSLGLTFTLNNDTAASCV